MKYYVTKPRIKSINGRENVKFNLLEELQGVQLSVIEKKITTNFEIPCKLHIGRL